MFHKFVVVGICLSKNCISALFCIVDFSPVKTERHFFIFTIKKMSSPLVRMEEKKMEVSGATPAVEEPIQIISPKIKQYTLPKVSSWDTFVKIELPWIL